MRLEDMPTKDLLVLHNELADKPAGPKSFKTKAKLIARIRQLNPELPRQSQKPKAAKAAPSGKVKAAEKPAVPRGSIGALARRILIDPYGVPYEDVAMFINHFVPGARATAQSVSWYASRMRKKGIDVPKRVPLGSVCIWIEDPATCDKWLADCGISKFGEL